MGVGPGKVSADTTGRYCEQIRCTRHVHCYGMHPTCSLCMFLDGEDAGDRGNCV